MSKLRSGKKWWHCIGWLCRKSHSHQQQKNSEDSREVSNKVSRIFIKRGMMTSNVVGKCTVLRACHLPRESTHSSARSPKIQEKESLLFIGLRNIPKLRTTNTVEKSRVLFTGLRNHVCQVIAPCKCSRRLQLYQSLLYCTASCPCRLWTNEYSEMLLVEISTQLPVGKKRPSAENNFGVGRNSAFKFQRRPPTSCSPLHVSNHTIFRTKQTAWLMSAQQWRVTSIHNKKPAMLACTGHILDGLIKSHRPIPQDQLFEAKIATVLLVVPPPPLPR